MSCPTVRTTHRPLPWLGATLALAVLACLPVAANEIYQWKDANGVTHYSDSPPANQSYQNRTVNNRAATPVAGAESASAKPAESDRCKDARTMLGQLQADAPVGIDADGDGKPDSIMNAGQRTAQTRVAEAAIAANCTSDAAAGAQAQA